MGQKIKTFCTATGAVFRRDSGVPESASCYHNMFGGVFIEKSHEKMKSHEEEKPQEEMKTVTRR